MAETAQHLTCQEVVELVTDYLERALPPVEVALFEEHLNFCEGCVLYVDQIQVTVAALGRLGEHDVPAETRDRLLTAFRDWKRA
jgi:predicted anti-sigma-YlaC factor YlaD